MSASSAAGHVIELQGPDEQGVARLRFETGRPLNAMTLPLVEDLLKTVQALSERTDVRVLALEGTATAFSGGADLRTMDSLDEAGYVYYLQTEFELFDVIERLPYVTVAVINGPCLGNAAELVLGCDFRLASTTATFGLSETKVGFSAPTQRLPHFVPVSVAKDLLFRGRILAAEEAGALNLFHEVVAPEELAERARAFLAELAQLPPVAIRLTKQKLALSYGPGAPGADDQMACALECYRTNDFREGVAAFFAKRAPNFTGT